MNITPAGIATEVFTEFPAEFRKRQHSSWGEANHLGGTLDCFLEGPSFDRAGNLYVTDIPFGRIFKIARDGRWTLFAEYDGWPNGLKIHANGDVYVADYRRGILKFGQNGSYTIFAETFRSEHFKGPNDLFFASNGDLYFTDQGQTGMQDPTGRIFRIGRFGPERLIGTIPSPNGIVLNLAESQVFVAVTRANAIWRMPLMADGGVSKVGNWIQLSGGLSGPDGLAMDEEGGLLVAHPGLTVIRFDRFGRQTHYLEPGCDLFCTNIAFDTIDRHTLYVIDSGRSRILRARMHVPGKAMYSMSTATGTSALS